jgi:DNA-binding MarR family transcriptional regulator
MEQRGLVARQRCASDQRGAVAVITRHGSDLIEAAAPQHVADVRSAFIDQLTPAQLEVLAEIGDVVRERLSTLNRKPQSTRNRPPTGDAMGNQA